MTTYKVIAQYTLLELVVGTQPLLQLDLLVVTVTNITPEDKKPKCILATCLNDMHQLDNGGKKRNPIKETWKQNAKCISKKIKRLPIYTKNKQINMLRCSHEFKIKPSKFHTLWECPTKLH